MSSEVAWRQLHPASMAVNLLPRAWRVVRGLWPLGLALLWRGFSDETDMYVGIIDGAVVLLFFLLTVGGTVRHWLTLRYRIARDRLEIRTGLLSRQIRTIDPARIQNVELVRTIPHRISGLVEVRVETASGTEVEGLLSALTVEEAEWLRSTLERLRDEARAERPEDAHDDDIVVQNGPRELFQYGATAGRLGAAAVALGLLLEGLMWVQPDAYAETVGSLFGAQGLALGVAVLAGAWLLGVGTLMVRHWGFTLRHRRGALVVEGGLTTRRKLELPLRKVQIVRTSETLVRRWVGFGSVTIETAAARSGEGGTERQAALVPVVASDRLPEVARLAVPDLDVDPWKSELRSPHRLALVRSISRRVAQALLGASLAGALLTPWALLLALVALPLAFAAWLDWRHQGWLVTEHTIIARRGFFDRRLTVVSRHRLQSVTVSQGPLLRNLGLGEVHVRVAGSRVTLPLMSWDEATDLVARLGHPVVLSTELPDEDEETEEIVPDGLVAG